MDYKIQNGKIGDESRFAYIQVEGWRAAYSDILAPEVLKKYLDIEYVTSIYRKLMERKKGNGLIMQVGEKDHCIAYWDRARNCSESNIAEIICIHSLKDNWRKGFGSKMMKRICDEASEQGYSQMILWVFEKNIRARLFYEANGFKITDKVQIALGERELCYIKSLEKNN